MKDDGCLTSRPPGVSAPNDRKIDGGVCDNAVPAPHVRRFRIAYVARRLLDVLSTSEMSLYDRKTLLSISNGQFQSDGLAVDVFGCASLVPTLKIIAYFTSDSCDCNISTRMIRSDTAKVSMSPVVHGVDFSRLSVICRHIQEIQNELSTLFA